MTTATLHISEMYFADGLEPDHDGVIVFHADPRYARASNRDLFRFASSAISEVRNAAHIELNRREYDRLAARPSGRVWP